MLGLVAFIMLSPQAREIVFNKWAGISEYIQLAAAPYHLYPIETTYTVGKTIDVVNNGGEGYLSENLAIPRDISTLYGESTMFEYTDGSDPLMTQSIQEINQIELILNGVSYGIPLLGEPSRMPDDKLITSEGHEIWWPGVGIGDDMCSVDICVKVKLNLDAGETASFTYAVSLTSTSYSWWSSSRVDTRVDGSSNGINVDRSGDFSDIVDRGGGTKAAQFTSSTWYNKGRFDYAINSQDAIVTSTAQTISASLPEGVRQMLTHLQEQLLTIYTLMCCTTKMPQWSLVVDHHVWLQVLVIVMSKPMLSFPSTNKNDSRMVCFWRID